MASLISNIDNEICLFSGDNIKRKTFLNSNVLLIRKNAAFQMLGSKGMIAEVQNF